MPKKIDLTGKRFGKLIVQREISVRHKGHILWLCACDCGGTKTVQGQSLRSGATQSCGCLQKKYTDHIRNWGGKREGAGSGGKRPGAGRPRSVARLKKGDYLVMERETIGGEIQQPQMWQVLAIGGDDGNVIEFQCGDDIIVLRPPDD